MKVWTDRKGKAVTGKEFIKRWSEGIQKVSPIEQLKVSLFSYLIIFIGVVWGMVLSGATRQWWLLTILSGSFIITGTQFTTMLQKYILLKKIEEQMKGGLTIDG